MPVWRLGLLEVCCHLGCKRLEVQLTQLGEGARQGLRVAVAAAGQEGGSRAGRGQAGRSGVVGTLDAVPGQKAGCPPGRVVMLNQTLHSHERLAAAAAAAAAAPTCSDSYTLPSRRTSKQPRRGCGRGRGARGPRWQASGGWACEHVGGGRQRLDSTAFLLHRRHSHPPLPAHLVGVDHKCGVRCCLLYYLFQFGSPAAAAAAGCRPVGRAAAAALAALAHACCHQYEPHSRADSSHTSLTAS